MRKSFWKKTAMVAAVTLMTVGMAFTSLAGSRADGGKGDWKKDHVGWWWQNEDGSWPSARWEWLDGNQDGIAECYYFDANGYMLANTTTPDGYTVNTDGAWVENGVVVTKQLNPYLHEVVVQNVGNRGGEITDGTSIEKIDIDWTLVNQFRTVNSGQADILKNAAPIDRYIYQHEADYNGGKVEVFVLEAIDQITSYRTTVGVLFPDFPEEGIELDAFYNNTGLKVQRRIGTSTGDSDATFDLPQATYRFTEPQLVYTDINGKKAYINIFILLTPGEDGKWYIYRDSKLFTT